MQFFGSLHVAPHFNKYEFSLSSEKPLNQSVINAC